MIKNIVITKQGNEAENSNNTLFMSPSSWIEGGVNLILFKNDKILINGIDYSVNDFQNVELVTSAKAADSIKFVITQLDDPSKLLSYDDRVQQLDRLNKKTAGKTQTSIEKRVTEETIPSKFIIHSDDVWTTTISSDISTALQEQAINFHTKLFLKEDVTVANQKGWYITIDNTLEGRIINWVPGNFGKSYIVRLYDFNDNEIPSSDGMNWHWDYQSGYLTIQNDFDFPTPFKITGASYNGRFGIGSLKNWKEPVFSVADFPLYHNDDGDIRLILTENKLYRFDSLLPGWEPLSYGSQAFKDPVLSNMDLPDVNNMRGDIRLVMEESNLYVFDDAMGLNGGWVLLTGHGFNPSNFYDKEQTDALLNLKSNAGHTHDTIYLRDEEIKNLVRWRPSRANFNDLPPYTENRDGDVILTRDNNTIYRWYDDNPNLSQGHWEAIFQSNFSWKTPVTMTIDLPTIGNAPGECRLVVEEQKIYFWDGANWYAIVADTAPHHHDDRYLLKTSLNWKQPVDNEGNLPPTNNSDGDIRLTLDTSIIYRWHNATSEWLQVIANISWLSPITTFAQLPSTAKDNDVIYIKEYNKLYVYDNGDWKQIESVDENHEHNDLYYSKSEVDAIVNVLTINFNSHIHDGINTQKIDYNNLLNIPTFYWKNPVVFEYELPVLNNNLGDARIVVDAKSIHVWDGNQWQLISNGTIVAEHDHDDRYYTETEVTDLIAVATTNILIQLNNKSDITHTHDDRYYTELEMDIAFADKADRIHSHPYASNTHLHDDRYYKKIDLQTAGGGTVHWDNITNKPLSITDSWQTPVQSESNLPLINNNIGDLRLVLDTSDVWRYDGLDWIIVGHWAGPSVDHWEAPVELVSELPYGGNSDGDIRLVMDEGTLYRWVLLTSTWESMIGGTAECECPPPDNDDGTGIGTMEIQVYINGLQGFEDEDWERPTSTSIRILADVGPLDIISILVIGDEVIRYNFRGEAEGQIEINLSTTFYRQELELSVQTSLFTIPNPYHPGQKDLILWVNGVLQRVGEDYTELSPTQFLFTRMLDVGDRILIVILGSTSGSESYSREDYVISELNQTVSMINEYAMGTQQLLVYYNGQLQLEGDDYTELDTTTIRFEDRLLKLDDFVTFIILKGLAVGGTGGSIINYASDLLLGWPTDNSWSDGYVELVSTMNVADAIDELNEAVLELIPSELISLEDINLESEGIDLVSGFIADGNAYIEGQPGDYFNYLTKNREFYLLTPFNNSFTKADQGTLRLFVNGIEVDNFSLEDAFVDSDRNGNQTAAHYGQVNAGANANVGVIGTGGAIRNSSNGFIQIMSINKYNYKKIQKGFVRFKFFNGLLRHGYNYIYVIHQHGSAIDTTKQFKFFMDTQHAFPEFSGTQTFFPQNIQSNKFTSGVKYYSIGDSFKTTLSFINMSYTVYSAEPLMLDMPGLKPTYIEYNDSHLLGVSNPPNRNDGNIEYRGVFVLNEFNEYSIDATLTVKTNTPFGPGNEYIFITKNRLVNTYTNGSSNLVEFFRDEIFRLYEGEYNTVPAQRNHIWNSVLPLEENQALLFDRGLRYANMSFVDYMPAQTVDYSNFTGPQTYYRAFYKMEPKNNGYFIIDGITKNDLLDNKIIIDIKLPTQTGWLSLNTYYGVSSFNGENSDGCLIDIVDNKFYYSSGIFSTVYSGFLLIFRVTLPDETAPTMTYLELKW